MSAGASAARPAGSVHGWVAHLRAGGTTPWLEWTGPAPAAAPPACPVPGAQQLELLRRVNLARESSARLRGEDDHVRTRLADRVLAATAAGRGHADLPLVGVGPPGFGARPVDPASVSAHELLRVASTLLADDLVALGPDRARRGVTRPWRRRVRLVGDPVVVASAREHLRTRGRPEGGTRAVVVAIGGPLDDLLAHTWTQRCFEHGSRPWGEWLRFWRERDQLPARADLDDSVRRWEGRRDFVRVVTDLDLLPAQLGVRRLPPARVPGADQAELARRVAAVVGIRVPVDQRPALMRTLQRRMPASGVPPVVVPAAERAWVASSAARLTRRLTRAGYPVVGDLADLAPRGAARRPGEPDEADGADGVDQVDAQQVLDLAVRMIADPGWRAGRERRVER